MRKGFCVASMVAMIVASAIVGIGPAYAGKPTEFIENVTFFTCDALSNGFGAANMGASVDDQFGPNAYVNYWSATADPNNDPPTLSGGTVEGVTIASNHVDATVPLTDEQGQPAGTATISADLVTTGPVAPTSDGKRFRNGNVGFRDLGTTQPLSVSSGLLTLPGNVTFDLTGCTGEIDHVDFLMTDPNALVRSFTGLIVQCSFQNDDSFFAIDAESTKNGGQFATIFYGSNGNDTAAQGPVTFTTSELSGTVTIPDVADVVLDATLTPGERFSYEQKTPNESQKDIGRLYNVSGTATLETSPPTVFDLSTCLAMDLRETIDNPNPSGPKPTGKAPSNDLADGASLVAPGTNLNIQTGAASAGSEQAVSCSDRFGDPESLTNTVWYRVVGAGRPITFDTAGSNFDTVIAAYTLDGGTYNEIGCVDDVPQEPVGFSLQSAITFPTEVGRTYYVQTGGLVQDPEFQPWGRLRLRVS